MVLYLDILAPALITFIPGLVIHLFIIVVNVNDWRKGRSVTPVDQVVTSLGISRMCAQCFVMLYLYVDMLPQERRDFNPVLKITMGITDVSSCFFVYANFWFTTLLSVIFSLKISNLRTRLILYLRRMMEQRTVHFIVASLLLSMVNSFLRLFSVLSEVMKGGKSNRTIENQLQNCSYSNYIYNYSLGASIPLLSCCISSVVLFTSLYHHTRRMKMSGNLSINLETYYSAMKFVSFTFVYNVIYFTGYFVNVIYYYFYCVNLVWLVAIVFEFLPALHSSYLIYRTAKLRSQVSKVLQKAAGFLFQRKDPETRENIELADQRCK